MPKKYHPAPPEMMERFNDAMAARYPELEDEKIRWDVQAVTADGANALSKGALALIKIVGPEERSRGGPDVRILVDLKKYCDYEEVSREAMFAHEIYHVTVAKTKNGKTRLDPYNRPKLSLKPDDWYITGFKQVADWYAEKSIERITHSRMEHALYHQTLLQFYMGYDDNGTGALPMGESEDAAHTARKREIEAEMSESGIIKETFAALIAVGNTESQARKAIESVMSGRGVFKTVSEMVDAIYQQKAEEVDVNAELVAGVRETEAARDIAKPAPSPQRDGEDAWRHILVVDLMLSPKSLERLQEHDIETVGELVTLTANGSLDSVLTGQVALDVDDCLERFSNGLPTAQAVDIARAKDPEPRPIEPKRTRARREKVGA